MNSTTSSQASETSKHNNPIWMARILRAADTSIIANLSDLPIGDASRISTDLP